MDKEKFNVSEFLYQQRVQEEKPMAAPDDVTLSIQNMLAEIRDLGYPEFQYYAM